jgi:hypothetical protein
VKRLLDEKRGYLGGLIKTAEFWQINSLVLSVRHDFDIYASNDKFIRESCFIS